MIEAQPQAPAADELKRQEVEAILASECFRRAPRLHQFLAYVCGKSLRGEAEDIKEYSIAVEALGRPPEFDHAKDAIVRVEAHRLRKRLALYYETEGAARPLRLTVPPGGYVPVFEPAPAAPAPAVAPAEVAIVEPPRPAAEVQPLAHSRRYWIAAGVSAALAPAAWWGLGRYGMRGVAEAVGPASPVREIHIAAGWEGGMFVDAFGREWRAEPSFEGGRAEQVATAEIGRTWNPQIYQRRRIGECRCAIAVEPGVYELALYFAETSAAEAGGRTFDVSLNGEPWLESFHILADAGGLNVETVKKRRDVSPSDDGTVRLEFRRREGQPLLQGVELVPSQPGRMLPVRIMAGRLRSYHHEGAGLRWDADRYFEGGSDVLRTIRVAGAENPNLFGGERYGSFRYIVPVVEGEFRLRMLFAETWFGESNPGRGGQGSRLFDILCNGRPLVKNFDPLAAAGGENRAVTLEFGGLRPNPRGKLEIEFVPRRNYAMVNATEIEETGR